MNTDPMTEDTHIVAKAYREEMQAGHSDLEAYRAAFKAYSSRYPEKAAHEAGREVADLIFDASARGDRWVFGRAG